ncbi:MAG: hypothetical protein IPN34_24765 [Planctomycetes bacterium]|nr:hypothetical protein [Planctomycetota bacterium]
MSTRLDRRDFSCACLLGLACLGLYLSTLQLRLFGVDAIGLIGIAAGVDAEIYWHPLYTRCGRLLCQLAPGADPVQVLRSMSAAGAAAAVSGSYLLCRSFGAARGSSALATALLAVAPAWWFFATTVEVYPPHVALVVCGALLVREAPRRASLFPLVSGVLAYPLVFLSHQTGILLLPGWAALILRSQRERGRATTLVGALAVCAALALALATAIALGNAMRGDGFQLATASSSGTIERFHVLMPMHVLREGWFGGLGLLGVLALGACFARVGVGARDLEAALLVLPSLAFFLWWGPIEKGGYFLATAPFLAAWAANRLGVPEVPRFPHPLRWCVAALLVAVQAALALSGLRAHDDGLHPERRVIAVRSALPRGGVLLSADGVAPDIAIQLRDVREISLLHFMPYVLEHRPEPRVFVEQMILPSISALVASEPAVALDLSYRRHPGEFALGLIYLDRLEDLLAERFLVRRVETHDWPLLLLGAPRTP